MKKGIGSYINEMGVNISIKYFNLVNYDLNDIGFCINFDNNKRGLYQKDRTKLLKGDRNSFFFYDVLQCLANIKELKYFFCIGDYQKRLDELEQKINLIEIERMPKKELRKFICYPHYLKFDLNEDYNIKAIPMFNLRKKKCYSSKPSNRCDNEIKKTNLSEFNSFENNLTKINSNKFNDLNIESFEGKNILSHSFDNVNEDMNLKEKSREQDLIKTDLEQKNNKLLSQEESKSKDTNNC